jgi:adhesin transport system membrane fusion protein
MPPEQSQALIKAELEMNLPLVKNGDVSRAEILKLQRQVAEIQGQITNRRNKYLQDILIILLNNYYCKVKIDLL